MNDGEREITTDGGAAVQGNVQVKHGDFAGRDIHKVKVMAAPRERPPKFQVASPPPDYIERERVEAELRGLLTPHSDQIYVVGLWGLPGVGKTLVAQQVTSQLKDTFTDGILWDDLQTRREVDILGRFIWTFEEWFDPNTLVTTKDYLGSLKQRLDKKKVLIVLEHVESGEAEMKARRLIELNCRNVVILLIFRTRLAGLVEPDRQVEVPVMTRPEATDLFKKVWSNDDLLSTAVGSTIQDLAEELCYMPVDMASVARDILKNRYTPEKYLVQLRQRKQAHSTAGTLGHFGLEEVYANLPDEGKQLLPFLGVLGGSPWEPDVLVTMSRLTPERVKTGLQQLIAQGFVHGEETSDKTPCYRVERLVKEFASTKLGQTSNDPLVLMAQALMTDYYLQAVQRTLLQYRGLLLGEFLADVGRRRLFVRSLSQLLHSTTTSESGQYFGAIILDPFQEAFEQNVLTDSCYAAFWDGLVKRDRMANQKPHVELCMQRALEQEDWPLLQCFAALSLGKIIANPRSPALNWADESLNFALIRNVVLRNEEIGHSIQWAPRIVDSKLVRCELVSMRWYGVHLHRADLRRIDMVGATLPGLVVINSTLSEVDARSADLRGAIFYRCSLKSAKFRDAKLAGAALINCDVDSKTVDFRDTALCKAVSDAQEKGCNVSPDQSIVSDAEDAMLLRWFLDTKLSELEQIAGEEIQECKKKKSTMNNELAKITVRRTRGHGKEY